jgi:DHA1 family bicyclomycin/chloramphenicol resistance-like MFS transporter
VTSRSSSTAAFIGLVALLNAMVAMSIDTMLPAIGDIAGELGATGVNSRQFVLTALFAGLCAGQLVYGPLSDSIGRKPAIFAGLAIYMVGTLICLFAVNFDMMLAGRAIEGIGAAGPRIVTMAMVRDREGGAGMARIMSFAMTIFILVPIVAPGVGQLVLLIAHWRAIFVIFLAVAAIAAVWLALGQPETLSKENRKPLSISALWAAAMTVFKTPVTIGYTAASGFIFGAFVSYLGTSQQIFAEQYGQGKLFAVYFAFLAAAIGIASILNARFVMRFGMRALSKNALRILVAISSLFLVFSLLFGGHPPFWAFLAFMFANFFFNGILFGNYNALAMEPMGRIAGMAASITGTITTFVSLVIGTLIGQLYDGTVIPLIGGFAGLAIAALIASEWAERNRQAA